MTTSRPSAAPRTWSTTSWAPPPRWPPTAGRPAATSACERASSAPPGPRSPPAPSIRFEDYPTEVAKREIRVTDAAARIANALHLHLD